ncbi:hypothetical protein MKX01_029295 [Papaver californicum]|nr:hypothetical protein MKX01_029295 [Papaver californicum]
MGFLCVADIQLPLVKVLAGLLKLIAVEVKLIVVAVLFHMGLPLFIIDNNISHQHHLFTTDEDFITSGVIPVTMESGILDEIKKRLPILEVGDFLDGSLPEGEGVGEGQGEYYYYSDSLESSSESETICAVCMNYMDRSHEMRMLSNCCHVFHRECLDKWVDQNQVTCPLCRSNLLPHSHHHEQITSNAEETSSTNEERSRDAWLVDRICYLFGEDLF